MKAFVVLIGGGLCLCIALALLPGEAQGLPECHIYRYTGLLCPGCGTTRALRALWQGDWLYSLHCNPLVLPAWVWLATLCCLRQEQAQNRVLWGGMIIAILFTILRNIPHPALDILRPL